MKKLLSLVLTVVLLTGFSGATVSAATTQSVSPYEEILLSINEEYNLDIGYIPVDESQVSIDEYEKLTRELAKEQRELLDYMAMREREALIQPENIGKITPLAVVSRTATQNVWNYATSFSITAKYNVNGTLVSGFTKDNTTFNLKLLRPQFPIVYGLSDPTFSTLDGGRTGGVKYKGTVTYGPGNTYSNVSLYTEFRYNS
jgi:hypothetical protein